MLTTKLTLSAEPALISVAKETAARQSMSVSRMFTKLINAMQDVPVDDITIAPITLRASGLVELPEQKTDSQLIEEALTSRYECDQ